MVSQRDLTGGERSASPGHRRGRERMVRRTERTLCEHGVRAVGQAGNRPDLGRLQRLGVCHVGKNGGQTPRQHGLSSARRADE